MRGSVIQHRCRQRCGHSRECGGRSSRQGLASHSCIKGGHSKGGTLVAETDPLPPIPSAIRYEIVVAEADLGPEANVMTHKHSGPETWCLLTGEQCLELPDRAMRARAGETMSAPAGNPYETEHRRSWKKRRPLRNCSRLVPALQYVPRLETDRTLPEVGIQH